MRNRFLALALSSSLLLAGCAPRVKNVTNLPTGVTLKQAQDWDTAIGHLHEIASMVSTLRKSLVDLHAGGALSDEYYVAALRGIAKVDQLELSAEAVLRQTPKNFSASTKQQVGDIVQQIVQQIQALNAAGATGIKNPTSLQTINKLLGQLGTAVNLILEL